jgi:hypothetical protein
MIPIKIQCGCGQRYAFDVEPVAGRLPAAVACPVCGTDGTAAANAVIAQSTPPQPAVAAVPAAGGALGTAVRAIAVHPGNPVASAPMATSRKAGRLLPGQIEPTQAEHEARAKIMWGDSTEAVIKFLMIHGFSSGEGASLVGEMFKERAITIRRNGIRKIVIGAALACVPVVAWVFFASLRILPVKLFALTVMVGLWGAWMLLKGTTMFVAPQSEPGDVSEQ